MISEIAEWNGLIPVWKGYVEKQNFTPILKKVELFWLSYCHAFTESKIDMNEHFFVKIEKENLEFSGRDINNVFWIIKMVCFDFLKCNEERTDIVLNFIYRDEIPNGEHCRGDFHLTKKEFKLYDSYIVPCWKRFLELSGARLVDTFIFSKKNIGVLPFEKSNQVKIAWKRNHTLRGMHQLSLEGRSTDYTILSKKGTSFHVHSAILLLHGGPVFGKLVEGKEYIESEQKQTTTEFSDETLSAFISFLYLGSEGFLEQMKGNKNMHDLFDIFKFSDYYELESLNQIIRSLIRERV